MPIGGKTSPDIKLGIIGAMSEEIELISNSMSKSKTIKKADITYYVGELEGVSIVLSKSGVGKVNAAICTQVMINSFNPSCIIFSGVAGGALPSLKIGDIIISTKTVQHDYDISAFRGEKGFVPSQYQLSELNEDLFNQLTRILGKKTVARLEGSKTIESDSGLRKIACKAYDDLTSEGEKMPDLYVGVIASGDQFIDDQKTKMEIHREFGAVCIEMEGAATGYVCHLNNVPFIIVRSISDNADGSAPKNFKKFCLSAARKSAKLIKKMAKITFEKLHKEIEHEYKWMSNKNRVNKDETLDRLKKVLSKNGKVGEWSETLIEDTYFDTDELILVKNNSLVRIRSTQEGRWVMCKLFRRKKGALFSRLELKRQIGRDDRDIQPKDTLRDVLRGSTVLEEIEEIGKSLNLKHPIDIWNGRAKVKIKNKRRILPVEFDNGIVGIFYFDEYNICSPDDEIVKSGLFEFELELLRGFENQNISLILDAIKKELNLTPSKDSKFERALKIKGLI